LKRNSVWVLFAISSAALLTFTLANARFGSVSAGRGPDDSATIQKINKRIIEADNSGDLSSVASLYEDDAVWLPPSGPVIEGKQAIHARYKATFAMYRLDLKENSIETHVFGEWGFVRGFTQGTMVPKKDGPVRRLYDKYLMIVHKGADQNWRIARLIWNPAGSNTE
jgi:uncharacterized protein (TIGR02246 family)